ncbi:MAG: C40 family peptidase [Promicromonosporaceae bacterium]|nr:C40 family peptidase [Promicromonosporaceae bacterium]
MKQRVYEPRHLAPTKPLAPLTEIANAVVVGQLPRRAAVVATASGLLMSSYVATTGAGERAFAADSEITATIELDAIARYGGDVLGDDALGRHDDEWSLPEGWESVEPDDAPEYAGHDDAADTRDDAAQNDDAGQPAADEYPENDSDYFAVIPGWQVEAAVAETPESVSAEGLAIVVATPAPPPPPPPARHVRGAAVHAKPASAVGNEVLEIAARYVGSPYRWGGTSPAGFDCSGFTQYVFGQLGINLPRSSGAQRHAGTVVSREEAQPGDLVWWPGHVGIFAEGNTFIDSAGPGRTVQFRNMWNSNPTFIRL